MAIEHRIMRANVCFHKWGSVLLSDAPLDSRLEFWSLVIAPSLLWGLESTRDQHHTHSYKKIRTCQRLQVSKMMKCKRHPIGNQLEPWLDFHIRCFRNARSAINKRGMCILDNLRARKLAWAGHIARFGIGPRETHLLKHVAAWRCTSWWRTQSTFNSFDWDPIKHFPYTGKPRRWEAQFSSNWLCTLAKIDE